MDDQRFEVERQDERFMQLLEEYNYACEHLVFCDPYDLDTPLCEDYSRVDAATIALYGYGAWVDKDGCWRSPRSYP